MLDLPGTYPIHSVQPTALYRTHSRTNRNTQVLTSDKIIMQYATRALHSNHPRNTLILLHQNHDVLSVQTSRAAWLFGRPLFKIGTQNYYNQSRASEWSDFLWFSFHSLHFRTTCSPLQVTRAGAAVWNDSKVLTILLYSPYLQWRQTINVWVP
jgi:hypothetical protein